MRNVNGFTLIELIVTLAVLAVLLSLAVPSAGSLIQDNRITGTANHLMAHLQYARSEAITRRDFVTACPSPDLQSCSGNRWDLGWIIFLDPERSGQPHDDDDILRVVQADSRMLMHSAGRYRVRFRPDGSAYGTNLTIRVCDPANQALPRAVIVSNPGRARVTRDLDRSECEYL